jgi:hypothetical protein
MLTGDLFALMNGCFYPFSNAYYFDPVISALKDSSIVGAYNKVNEVVFDAGNFLGEIGETIALIKKPFSSSVKLANEMYSRARRKVKHYPKKQNGWKITPAFFDALSGQWLEYRYGIMPMIYDATDLMDLVDGGLTLMDEKLSVKAKSVSETRTHQADGSNVMWPNVFPVKLTYRCHRICMHKSVTKIYFMQNLDTKGLGTRGLYNLGLHPTQVKALAWELAPLSFVADWFLNVGSWLNARQINPTIKIVGSCTTYKNTEYNLWTLVSAKSNAYGTYSRYGGHPFQVDAKRIVRTLDEALPDVPVININHLSYDRQRDACALSYGFLSGFFKAKQTGPGLLRLERRRKANLRMDAIEARTKNL